jgi:hypothetical protein
MLIERAAHRRERLGLAQPQRGESLARRRLRASFRSRTPRHALLHTRCVAIAEAAAANI